jgi:hypothetical protein
MDSGEHAWLRESTHSFGRAKMHKLLGKSERVQGLPMTSHMLPCRRLRRQSGIAGARGRRRRPQIAGSLRPITPGVRRRQGNAVDRSLRAPKGDPRLQSKVRSVWDLLEGRHAGLWGGVCLADVRMVGGRMGRAARRSREGRKGLAAVGGVGREFRCRRTSFRFHLLCTAFHLNDVGCDCTCQKEFAM